MTEEEVYVVDYLEQLEFPYEEIGDSMWRVHNDLDDVENIIVSYNPPLVLFRINVMEVPEQRKEAFFRRLLKLNLGEIPHGAFALENGKVVVVDTLQAETMDFHEFRSSIEAISYALTVFYNEFKDFER